MRYGVVVRSGSPITIFAAALLSVSVLVLGYALLGIVPTILFTFGFVGGFALWLLVPTNSTFNFIAVPYFLTLGAFVLHKIEERQLDFFPALSRLTGVPVPDTSSPLVFLLYASAGAWLLIPFLVKRQHPFGYYLAWTFFTSMGVIELAHFVFPLFDDNGYGYFPGMASTVLLAPLAWWGLIRLRSGKPVRAH
jgi:hypothetical protein